MAKHGPFEIIFDSEVFTHLATIERKLHTLIFEDIQSQLQYEPERETRNRKPLSNPVPFGVAWELRLGPNNRFRVFYRVDADHRQVHILAILTKVNNKLYLGGVEFTPETTK